MNDVLQDPQKRFLSRHIHTAGNRCGSPPPRNRQFCYFHDTTRQPPMPIRMLPNEAIFGMPSIEDRHSIQHALAIILCHIAGNSLDSKRAGLLLYGLQIASANLPREPRTTTTSSRASISESSTPQD